MTDNEQKIEELMEASCNGDLDKVKALIEEGADVNAKDEDGYTPLHCAAFHRHLKIVKYLIENGADVNATNENGGTSLYVAEEAGYHEIFNYIESVNKQRKESRNGKVT